MLVYALTLTLAHQPHFPHHNFPFGSHERSLAAEPSVAYYDYGRHTYTIKYKQNDFMYVTVLAPAALGFYSSVDSNVTYDVTVENCTYGREAENEHAKNQTPGTLSYEPFGESELVTIKTPVSGHVSNTTQTCIIRINASDPTAPYVFVAGTEEKVLEAMVAGLPLWVALVSAWNSNHVYVYTLFVLLLCAAFIGAKRPKLAAAACAAAVLLTSAVSRSFQVFWAGWGVGLLFILIPTLSAVAVIAGRRQKKFIVGLTFFTLISPTHSWIDVIALAFVVYTFHTPDEMYETGETGNLNLIDSTPVRYLNDYAVSRTTRVPSTVNPAPSFVVRY